MVADITETRARSPIAIPVLLAQAVVFPIFNGSDHTRTYLYNKSKTVRGSLGQTQIGTNCHRRGKYKGVKARTRRSMHLYSDERKKLFTASAVLTSRIHSLVEAWVGWRSRSTLIDPVADVGSEGIAVPSSGNGVCTQRRKQERRRNAILQRYASRHDHARMMRSSKDTLGKLFTCTVHFSDYWESVVARGCTSVYR